MRLRYSCNVDINEILRQKISSAVSVLFDVSIKPDQIQLEHPKDEKWGDISCNVSLKIARDIKQSPIDIAKKLSYEIQKNEIFVKLHDVDTLVFQKIDFQAPGFLNFTYSTPFLVSKAFADMDLRNNSDPKSNMGLFRGQKVLCEYTDPNPFKVFHIGHLMSNAIGESISRIYQYLGADLKRVNYQGDVGLHVAKSIWGLLKGFEEEGFSIDALAGKDLSTRVAYLGKAYARGAQAYSDDSNPTAKEEIHELNYLVYIAAQERLVEEENWIPVVDYKQYLENAKTFDYSLVKKIYALGRAWSLEDFEILYAKLGTKFDGYYFESKVGEYGLDIVNKHISDGVFTKENGATIFKGEEVGLHTRVFVNSKGLPTYEAKDLGLAFLKYESFKYDKSFIITANEINEYFKVVLKAMSLFSPELSSKTTHIGHGVLRFKTGKMSSRTGDVLTGVSLIQDTKQEILEIMEASSSDLDSSQRDEIATDLAIGAIKYSILKQSPGKDIIYDKDKAIAITGDTGPYLQYTHARANSILEKAGNWSLDLQSINYELGEATITLEETEIALMKQITKFEETIVYAEETLAPSVICDYLFELSQRFNTFYNDMPILTATHNVRNFRLMLTKRTKDVLKDGLWVLGISSPSHV